MIDALDLELDVMRKTPHSRLKKSAFELHYGRKPNTEVNNLLKQNCLTVDSSISAKPDTLQVYSFHGEGGQTDLLPMKAKRKTTKGVSSYPFYFFEKKHQKSKFESPYYEEPRLAINGTKHTVTTHDNRVLHRKHISKPINDVVQEPSSKRQLLRTPDGRFKSAKKPAEYELISDEDLAPSQTTTSTMDREDHNPATDLTPL